ncbi:MAG: glutamine-hydrolyzing GMP synthase [Chitinispirillaceae bacterium]|jgi:GMP synthase (glutamine-hydrolysing)|nr:glutamine-hydrolyzing GMP synthase [Chitinispirillaceae bacterium]
MSHAFDTIAVVDFGGQYSHLIANRIRRLGAYSEIVQTDATPYSMRRFKGIILSGGPHSVLDQGSPTIDKKILDLGIPVLGLCYGHQLIAKLLGGSVTKGTIREYGKAMLCINKQAGLFNGLEKTEQVWMSHGDTVEKLAPSFEIIGSTDDCAAAAVANETKKIYGLQFHPEVTDTPHGMKILGSFIDLCSCRRDWNPKTLAESLSADIREKCGNRKVFLLVSGGVDSSVAFALLIKALGPDRVMGLHIDNGLMRYRESEDILDYLKKQGFHNLRIQDGTDDFLGGLAGVAEPEKKRNIIGNMFITVKEKAFAELDLNPNEWILAQGTIYPDTIESAGTKHADLIKTHHNRVDIILELIERGLVIEPLAQLYKDEVRELGESLGLPRTLVWRHPFPGPGLGVRVLCSDGRAEQIDASASKALDVLAKSCGYSGAILPIKSVGVQGDGRTYAHPALITGPENWFAIEELSTKITNTVRAVNRVVYGVSVLGGAYRLVSGYVTKDRLDKLRAIDHVVTEALLASGEYDTIWQMPVVLLPLVNEAGGECVVLRPITSQEAMTARFMPLRKETLAAIVDKAKKISGVGDLFFDATHKPPGTIEWE